MGSKSKSKSSTTTNQTDSRQFRLVEQGLAGEAAGLGSIEANRSRVSTSLLKDNEIDQSHESNLSDGSVQARGNVHRNDLGTGAIQSSGNVSVVDGGAIKAIETVAGFAINAASGGVYDIAMRAGELVSMISENSAQQTEQSYSAIESLLAEKQTDGDQDNQKTLLYIFGGVAVALVLVLGGKKK